MLRKHGYRSFSQAAHKGIRCAHNQPAEPRGSELASRAGQFGRTIAAVFLMNVLTLTATGQTSSIQILSASPSTISSGGRITLTIRVTNTGTGTWSPVNPVTCSRIDPPGVPSTCAPHPAPGEYTVYLDIRPAGARTSEYTGGAFHFDGPVEGGSSVEITDSFDIHLPPGNYTAIPWTAIAANYGFGPNGKLHSAADVWDANPHYDFAIAASDPPSPDFTWSPANPYARQSVQFTDSSTGGPASWAWDFTNDGSVDSTMRNPVHSYAAPGTYTVRLTVANEFGQRTTTKSITIDPAPVPTYASRIELLSTSPPVIEPGGAIKLSVRVQNTGSQLWAPVNTVSCPQIDPPGSNSACAPHPEAGTFTLYVDVRPAGQRDAEFTGGAIGFAGSVEPGAVVDLSGELRVNLPPGDYTAIPWTALAARFGFGPRGQLNSAREVWDENPHFDFSVRGLPAAPIASFTWSPLNPAPDTRIQFRDLSSNASEWEWDFTNDGVIDSRLTNPVTSYSSPGTYRVRLTVRNGAGENTTVRELTVVKPNLPHSAVVQIVSAGPDVIPPGGQLPLTVRVTNTGTIPWSPVNTAACLRIDPPGIPSTCAPDPLPGKYTLYLDIRPAGQSDTEFTGGAFRYQAPVNSGETVDVSGSFTINLPPGAYTAIPWVALAAGFGFGPEGVLHSARDVWNANPRYNFFISGSPALPRADFSFEPVSPMRGTSVSFKDLSTGGVTSHSWDFNSDGVIDSTFTNPSFVFTTPGTFLVSLTVLNAGGHHTLAKQIVVQPRPAALSIVIPPPIVQRAGGEAAQVTFPVTNEGDSRTHVTLVALPAEREFFSIEPVSFELNPGESQVISVVGSPQPAATTLTGLVRVSTGDDQQSELVPVVLVVSGEESAGANVFALSPRIDISAPDSQRFVEGEASFRNSGSARAVGVLTADVPWITTDEVRITVDPGQTVSVKFISDRSKRPDADALTGTSRATLSLILPRGSSSAARGVLNGELASTVPVLINDTAAPGKPRATAIPPLKPPEVALFVPGVGHVLGGGGKLFISDFSLSNSSLAGVDDLKYYYKPGSNGDSALAVDNKVLSGLSNQLMADVVNTAFERKNELGAMQVRSRNMERLTASANVFVANDPRGTFGTAIPVFRSDRVAAGGDSLSITGILKNSGFRTNLYIQETTGVRTDVSVSFRDSAGQAISTRKVAVEPFGMTVVQTSELEDDVLSSVLITNSGSGGLVAFATPVDNRSGDTWAVTDWRRYYQFSGDQRVVFPVAGSARGAGDLHFRTDVSMTNTLQAHTTAVIRFTAADGLINERQVVVPAGRTIVLKDIVGSLFSQSGLGYLTVTPEVGADLTMSSRTYATRGDDPATFGSGVPPLPQSFALRTGQSRVFGGLRDAAPSKIGRVGGTFRLNLGLVEISGQPSTVRVSILLPDGTALGGGFKDSSIYTLKGGEFRQINGIVADIIGAERRAQLGDLNALQLKVDGLKGEGSVIPYASLTDNGSGDTVLRVD